MAKTVQGFVLIDVDVAALNNAGKDTSTTMDNAVATKKILKGNKWYAYVSGQAWRYWWRDTLKREFNWKLSPIVREKKTAFTQADPVTFPDDDIFGYMRAAKEEITDSKGKKKKQNITLTRVSPLKNSALISVAPTKIEKNWSSMTRHEGDAVPFGKDEYCATMKGMFSIALEQAGTFSSQERTGFKNLNEKLKNLAMDNNAEEMDDPFAMDAKGNPLKLYRLQKKTRLERIRDTVKALEVINGGAMQTNNMADVTPKLIVLTTLNSANHPFSHLAKINAAEKAEFSIPALKQVVQDYSDRIEGRVFIGRRMGFMDELEDDFKEYSTNDKIFYGSINQAIREYIKQMEMQIP